MKVSWRPDVFQSLKCKSPSLDMFELNPWSYQVIKHIQSNWHINFSSVSWKIITIIYVIKFVSKCLYCQFVNVWQDEKIIYLVFISNNVSDFRISEKPSSEFVDSKILWEYLTGHLDVKKIEQWLEVAFERTSPGSWPLNLPFKAELIDDMSSLTDYAKEKLLNSCAR